jgi:hypothetical protein
LNSWQAVCVVSIALCGCATPYESESGLLGFSNHHGPGTLETVYFSGNYKTPPALVQKYVLYRCAEIARDKGAPYFVIYDSLYAATSNLPDTMPRVGIPAGGAIAYAFVLPLNAMRPGAKETAVVLRELDPTKSIQQP